MLFPNVMEKMKISKLAYACGPSVNLSQNVSKGITYKDVENRI